MSEMSLKESQQAHGKEDATAGPTKVSGLGALLRSERENRGLSHEQVAQITRLRKPFLEALENEEWENLPPSVFVKGFIKSYAKALGLDEGKLLDLYKSTLPDEVEPPIPILIPKKPRKKIPFVLALCLIALSIAIYLFIGRPSPEQSTVQSEEGLPAQIQEEPTKEETRPVLQENTQEELLKKQEETVEVAPPRVGVAEMEIPDSQPQKKESTSDPTDEDFFAPSEADPSGTADWRVLTGIVHLRTWIRIYIDDEAPKEYILQPGSRPQWKAKKGFYVLLGNAAGMDFEFDGKDIKDIGELGQVVSLRLPEGFDRVIAEE
jgi:cytoskeletal protein RodZ